MDTKNMGEIIKSLRTQRGMTQEELGKIIGVQKSAIRKYESGVVQNIKRSSIKKLADFFGISPTYLLGYDTDYSGYGLKGVEKRRFPMLGTIAAGEPILATESFETFVEASATIDADFCLTVKGDSMLGANIHNGDVVFIKKQDTVDNGQIAAVVIGDEATLKRFFYYPNSNKLVLHPENPAYEPLVYVGDELSQVKIIGKAVYYLTLVK